MTRTYFFPIWFTMRRFSSSLSHLLTELALNSSIILLNFSTASFEPPDLFSDSNPLYPPVRPTQTPPVGMFSAPWPMDNAGIEPLGTPGSETELDPSFVGSVQDNCVANSRNLCITAARSIVSALTLVRLTSFDITTLHPFVATTWYMAAVVLLHEHQYCVDTGDFLNKGLNAKDVQLLR